MKTYFITVLMMILFIEALNAQKKSRLNNFNFTEFGIYFGSRDKLIKEEFHERITDTHTAYIISFRNIKAWEISQKFALGLGIGYEGIIVKGAENPDKLVEENGDRHFTTKYTPGVYYHTLPIFGQARFYFRKNPESAFIYTDLGSFFNLNREIKRSLLLWGVGVGQRYQIKSGALISVGLDFQERYLITLNSDKHRIPAIGLKAGVLFH